MIAAISIVINVTLAWSTWLYARAANDQVNVEREQLVLFQRQLTLAQSQFAATQEAARPKLRAFLLASSDQATGGSVTYIHGTEPAYDVEIWVRGLPRQGEAWGLRFGKAGIILPRHDPVEFTAWPATAQEQERLQLDKFMEGQLAPGECLVGLTWKLGDGTLAQVVDRQFPPRQPGTAQ